MTTFKWLLAAVGAYLLYRWWSDSQAGGETVENAPLPSDTGMWDDSGGGGGGGSAGGGDYQAPPNVSEPPPAPVKVNKRPGMGLQPLARAPRDPAPVKPAAPAGPGGKFRGRPRPKRPTPPPPKRGTGLKP